MKETLKSIGVLLYFLLCQMIATVGIMMIKISIDEGWLIAVNDSLNNSGMLSREYFGLVFEILYPALIAADIIIIIPMLISAAKKKQKLIKRINIKDFCLLFNLAIVLNFIVSFIVANLPTQTTSSYDDLMQIVLIDNNFFLVMLTSGILAPIIEEFVFRYAIIEIFSKKGRNIAIFISALMFGFAHFNIIQSSHAFILGLILGYLYWNGKNLLKPVIVHLIINSTSVLYEYAPGYLQNIMLVIVAISFVILLVQLYNKKNIDKTEKI